MSVLSELIAKEEHRNKLMIIEYTKELETLPKGSIKAKKVHDKTYYYLVFRIGSKVITQYVGKSEIDIADIKGKLTRRKQVEKILKRLAEESLQIKKAEAVL